MQGDTDTARASGQMDTDRLRVWLSQNVAGFQGPMQITKFEGGQSNPTFKIAAASGDYVLRRKPPGPVLPSAHAVDREYRVLSALSETAVPVPKVHALCLDEAVLGSMFYVMDMIPGRTFWDPRLPDQTKAERAAIFDGMNQTIAAIHSIDPKSVGLEGFGRSENYLQRQVSRWTKQYHASATIENPAMDKIIEWLPKHLPQDNISGIVHGDYRLDNVLIHPSEPRIVAVLDWELSTIGNPLADFAYHVMTWRFAPELFRGLGGEDLKTLGIPDETEYLETYLRRTGFDRPDDWEFYVILSMFRLASILQGIAKRAITGTAANADAVEVGAKAVPISELAWGIIASREG
ncbi:phosphotransferase [Thalassovita taeanensis]|uniref:Predicted kinase, aminoglycoside phosphotransferase (APT) family n=1 Tax=Thalassovita taeanensis TaxID=657014 RepID=A0A1H9BBQ4_9RHOB|nr:phosphotransferase [Thalassovita taeanensis]SEP85688.1 Predicted kinase, aminoglycoside phosphotransferase (APT) family [Thalassovita taeanensis]